jgi:CheY-like chemotaxis protein
MVKSRTASNFSDGDAHTGRKLTQPKMPRILIIDDDDAMRRVTKEHLSSSYEVIDTGVPEAALGLAVEHKPDAILLDLSMPDLSGLELCHAFSSLSFTQNIPIFIISGQDERNKAFCQNLGAFRYFTKPIKFGKLKEDLAAVLASKQFERRTEVRVRVKLPLTLKGKKKDGSLFDARVETENMSKGGFLCSCPGTILDEGTSVEVSLSGEPEHRVGNALLVRVVKAHLPTPRYGFQFSGLW